MATTDISSRQAMGLTTLANDLKVGEERMRKLLRSGLIADVLRCDPEEVNRAAVRRLLGLDRVFQVEFSTTDRTSWIDLLKAAHLKQLFLHIAEALRRPGSRVGPVDFELVRLPKIPDIESEFERALSQRGYMNSADLHDLLVFAAQHPEEVEKHPIVGARATVGFGKVGVIGCYDREGGGVERILAAWGAKVANLDPLFLVRV